MPAKTAEEMPADDTVLITAAASPFDGMTIGQARVLNGALSWCRVEVTGGKFPSTRRPEQFVFQRILLPGDRPTFGAMVGDLELWGWDEERDEAKRWLGRIISPSLVRSFRVIEAPELSCCSQCFSVLPQSKLIDAGPAYFSGDWCDYQSRLECRPCFEAPF